MLKAVLALAVFALLYIAQEWLWRRTSSFMIYKGESRIRRGRSVAHLSSEHYTPEGHRWLAWYALAYLATGISFLVAFLTLGSWLAGPRL